MHLHLAAVYALLCLLLAVGGLMVWRAWAETRLSPGMDLLWGKVLHAPEPALIVLGVHTFDASGKDISAESHVIHPQPEQTLFAAMTRSDLVHLSDLTSYGSVVRLLTAHHHAFRTQGAADTTLEQLRQQPFILVGGFNNLWTTKLTAGLRFRLVTLNAHENVIQDSLHPEVTWRLDSAQGALNNTRDYGLVSCFFDPATEQYVMIAAGIGKSGTEAATDFLTNEQGLETWLKSVRSGSGGNRQMIVATDVIEGKHGPPHVVAAYSW